MGKLCGGRQVVQSMTVARKEAGLAPLGVVVCIVS